MAVEDRVAALENELKILKNQIQSTLLEIKDQVLIHYYPDLRTNGSAREGGTLRPQANEAPQPALALPEPVAAVRDDTRPGPEREPVALEGNGTAPEQEPMLPDQSPALPENGTTGSQANDNVQMGERSDACETLVQSLAQPEETANWVSFAQLMAWARESVEELGRERTRQAVEICASGGFVDPETKDTLLQLIALGSDSPHMEVGSEAVIDAVMKLNLVTAGSPNGGPAAWPVEEDRVG